VRARLVESPGDWPWSSYHAHTGAVEAPPWLDGGAVAGMLLGRTPRDAADAREVAARYRAHVAEGHGDPLWSTGLRQQVFLGDEAFVQRMQARAEQARLSTTEVPRPQRADPHSLAHWLAICPSREEALLRGHRDSGLSMSAMARELGLSVARVSQLLSKAAKVPKADSAKASGASN
jgi:DNA-directed RNA polymerase specialized sigma24 family protein